MPEERIAHYRILEPLGEGGMGAVYKAEDTHLGRTVALKVLTGQSREDRQRFLREARASAVIEHPNICPVHDVGEHDGRAYLAMSYVEGRTLKQKIAERPLKLNEALDIALQAAEGLQAAHQRGVVHRDIKSANIMVTPDGRVKLLDFGLAKISGETQITTSGTVVGTPAYMSPEQARGGAADRRSDIWSLGVVIYEMLSGRTPFAGETSATVLRAILDDEAEPVTALRSGLPPDLDRILAKALAKDPRDRYQNVEDLAVDLRAVGRERSSAVRVVKRRTRWPWIAAAVVVVAMAGGWLVYRMGTGDASHQVMRFISPLPEGYTFSRLDSTASAVVISADGQKIVFSATKGDKNQLFRREIGDFTAQPIPGTENGVAPFLSRDGRWVGFAVGHEVRRVPYAGGTGAEAKTLAPLMNIDFLFQGGDFDEQGNPIIGQCSRGLRRVSMSADNKSVMTDVHDREATGHHIFPFVLPGGEQLLFTRANSEQADIWLLNRLTGRKRKLIAKGTCARYLPPGYIVYASDGDLYAVAFDLKNENVMGAEVKVVSGLVAEAGLGLTHWSVSDNGTLVYVPGLVQDLGWHEQWVDVSGKIERLADVTYGPLGVGFHLSPDGTRALESRGWIMDESFMGIHEFGRNIWRKISPGRGSSYWAVWTPDGRSIVYQHDANPVFDGNEGTGIAGMTLNLYSIPADLSRPPERLTTSKQWQHPSSFSPDGRVLAFVQGDREDTTNEVWMLPMDTRKPYPFVASHKGDTHPAFSPDGHWLAYASKESGRWEVLVRPFPGSGGVIQVSTEGGWEPIWSRDGRRIFFRTLDGETILSAAFMSGSPPRIEPPVVQVQGRFWPGNGFGHFYDVGPDGKRFLVISKPAPVPPVSQYVVVLNWVEELKRLVPRRQPD